MAENMMKGEALAALITLSLLLLLLGAYLLRDQSSYPPGPRSYIIIGHTFQVPRTHLWRYFLELGKTYGPIVRVTLAGDDIIALNDSRDAEELLNRRSANYSTRAQLVYAGKYLSGGKRLVMTPYGEEMKRQRAAFHRMLQPCVVGSYESMQELESVRLLNDMLLHPKAIDLNTRRNFIQDCYPGSHLVDTFPILDRLPDFLSPWRVEAKLKHKKEVEVFSRLVMQARSNMEREGEILYDCFASRLWEEKEKLRLDLITMSYICGVAFDAGTDSTSATMSWFIMAMALNPAVLERAQREINSVVGADGTIMPSFVNFEELPYCGSLCKEVFRWRPAAPGGFPHLSDAEDEYKGFKIKAKTMVIPNTFAIHHNEEEFPDPDCFKPEHFMSKDMKVSTAWLTEGHYGFGFGRRACPGKYLASKMVWIGIVRFMWAFHIFPAKDSSGNHIVLDPNVCTPGITTKPRGLFVDITSRTSEHAANIEKMWGSLSQ